MEEKEEIQKRFFENFLFYNNKSLLLSIFLQKNKSIRPGFEKAELQLDHLLRFD